MTLTLPATAHADNAQRTGGVADLPFSPPQAMHSPRLTLTTHDGREHAFAERMRMWDAIAEVRRETVAFVQRMPEYRRQHEAGTAEGPIWLCAWRETAGDLAGFAEVLHVLEAGMVFVGERPPVHLPIRAPEGFGDAHGLLTARIYDLDERIDCYLSPLLADESSAVSGGRPGDAFYAGLRCAAWAARQMASVMQGEVNGTCMKRMAAALEAAEIDAVAAELATA